MNKFLYKCFLFCLPVFVLVGVYFYTDPFQILYNYTDEEYAETIGKSGNLDRISTQKLLNNYPKYHYQSYIFGNSRSSAFLTGDWGKHINDSLAFHYTSSSETLYGMYHKFQFLKKQNYPIKNALLVFDYSNLDSYKPSEGSVFIKDYRTTGSSFVKYHVEFLKSFFQQGFFVPYLQKRLTGTFLLYMKNYFEYRRIVYTPIHNDFLFPDLEKECTTKPEEYYKNDVFYKRPEKSIEFEIEIKQEALAMLEAIASDLKAQKTHYKVILAPLYDQKSYPKHIKEHLNRLFGAENVYDYAGKNEFTNDIHNYYESSHFRPNVGREILKNIYEER